MAFQKQNLKWNKMDLGKVKGEPLNKVNEAIKALELADAKVKAAKAALEPLFDNKTFPKAPSGKVVRLSLKLDWNGKGSLTAAAAEPTEKSADNDSFSW